MDQAAGQPQKQAQQQQHADQAKFFANHGQQKVGMRFGQPVQLFDTAAQANTKNLAPANGDERVGELVALAQCVVLAPGVEVGKNARAAIVVKGDHERKGCHQHAGDQEEHARIHAAQKQDAHGNHGNHHECAHVGLGQQQAAHDGHGRGHGPDGFDEIFFELNLAHHIARRIQHRRKLGQLGGLEADDAQRDPAPCAIHALANKGQQHR